MVGKITDLSVLPGALAAGGDLLEAVDVSDTSMAATGTNKKMSLTDLVSYLAVNGISAPMARGVVAAGTSTFSGSTALTANMVLTNPITFVTLSSRRYKLTFQANFYGTGAIEFGLYSSSSWTGESLWVTGNASTWTTANLVFWRPAEVGSNQAYNIRLHGYAGAGPFQGFGSANTFLLIEDVGPVP